ncbi:uncharacterized protein LOC117291870 [Asterias rubens]|uniref:uncharacterized protein LOC117291870 n=1 Tax=Asterias rubens TaxID=7604 RepID=UPI001455A502|nr:uncharacterized protein LOC117291870 [Asterias rubens]XP_033629714.1 uncharacterized protein LOC117291870 [Asterias rubens]
MEDSIPPADVEEAFIGKWKSVKTEGMDEFAEVFNIEKSKIPENPYCELDITKDGEGAYIIVNKSDGGLKTQRHELGKPLKDNIMGREVDIVTMWNGRRLVTSNVKGDSSLSRSVVDGMLVCVVMTKDFTITTTFERC